MNKKKDNNIWIWITLSFILGLILSGAIFLSLSPNKNIEPIKEDFYCNINVDNVKCSSNYDCTYLGPSICDTKILKCVKANINLEIGFSGGEEECINYGGEWILKEKI